MKNRKAVPSKMTDDFEKKRGLRSHAYNDTNDAGDTGADTMADGGMACPHGMASNCPKCGYADGGPAAIPQLVGQGVLGQGLRNQAAQIEAQTGGAAAPVASAPPPMPAVPAQPVAQTSPITMGRALRGMVHNLADGGSPWQQDYKAGGSLSRLAAPAPGAPLPVNPMTGTPMAGAPAAVGPAASTAQPAPASASPLHSMASFNLHFDSAQAPTVGEDMANQWNNGVVGQKTGSGGYPMGLRAGGKVTGPGGPTEDKVPAMLSAGEYVLPADTVQAVGKENLDDLRARTHTPVASKGLRHMASGGFFPPVGDYSVEEIPEIQGQDIKAPPRLAAPPSPQAQAYLRSQAAAPVEQAAAPVAEKAAPGLISRAGSGVASAARGVGSALRVASGPIGAGVLAATHSADAGAESDVIRDVNTGQVLNSGPDPSVKYGLRPTPGTPTAPAPVQAAQPNLMGTAPEVQRGTTPSPPALNPGITKGLGASGNPVYSGSNIQDTSDATQSAAAQGWAGIRSEQARFAAKDAQEAQERAANQDASAQQMSRQDIDKHYDDLAQRTIRSLKDNPHQQVALGNQLAALEAGRNAAHANISNNATLRRGQDIGLQEAGLRAGLEGKRIGIEGQRANQEGAYQQGELGLRGAGLDLQRMQYGNTLEEQGLKQLGDMATTNYGQKGQEQDKADFLSHVGSGNATVAINGKNMPWSMLSPQQRSAHENEFRNSYEMSKAANEEGGANLFGGGKESNAPFTATNIRPLTTAELNNNVAVSSYLKAKGQSLLPIENKDMYNRVVTLADGRSVILAKLVATKDGKGIDLQKLRQLNAQIKASGGQPYVSD